MSTYDRAVTFATKAHVGQTRKHTGEWYITHPIRVAELLQRCGIDQEHILVAALLHDVLEDCPMVSKEAIGEQFGDQVLSLVKQLTNVRSTENRQARKRADLLRLRDVSAEAQTIKCADIADNLKDFTLFDPDFALMFLEEKSDLHAELTKADPVVYAWAERELNKAWDFLEKI